MWARLLHEAYGYEPVYFAAIEGRSLSALFPFMEVRSIVTGKRGLSLPFTDYCRPILPAGTGFHDALAVVVRHGARAQWRSIEVRSDANIPAEIPPSARYYRHTLDLAGGETALQSNLRAGTRRNIRKAEKAGVSVTLDASRDAVQEFYRLNCLTRQRHGLPPQPFRYFEKLREHLLAKDHGTVALASFEDKIIAGAVFLHFGKQAVFKYGASDFRCQHLRANNLVMWEGIRAYARKGCRTFCFGRTEPENEGLLQFKRGWGAHEEPIHYCKYDLKQHAFVRSSSRLTGMHNRICRLLPLPLLRLAGTLLYRHVA